MNTKRRGEIAFLYALNAVKRKRIKIPHISELSQALDVLPQTAETFLKYIRNTKNTLITPSEFWTDLAYAFIKLNTKEDGFMLNPLTLRKKVAESAKEINISYKEACIFIRDLLKELLDEIFSEFE